MNEASESNGNKSESSASQLSDRSNCSSAASAGLSKERQIHSVVSPRSVQISLSSSSSSSSSNPPRMNCSFSSSTPHNNQYQHHVPQKHELQDIFATHQNIHSRPLQKEIMKSSSCQHVDDDDDDDDYCTLPFLSIEAIPTTTTTTTTRNTTTSATANSPSGTLIGNSKSNHHVQLKQIIERQYSCSDEDDDLLPFSIKQQKQHEEVFTSSNNAPTDNYNYNIANAANTANTAKASATIVTNQFVSIDENNLKLSSEYQNQNDQSLVKFASSLSMNLPSITNSNNTFGSNMASDQGESLSQSTMTNNNNKKNNHKLLSSSSIYSNEYHSQVQNSSSNHNDVINFSTIMRQLDDNNSFTATQTQSSNALHKSQHHQDSKSDTGIGIQSPSSMSLTHNLLRSTTRGRKGRAIALSDVTTDSFKLCVELSPTISVRDVVDVIANPDMLRFWCEPISALVVTDHKGGSALSMTPLNNNDDGRKKLKSNESYHYPDVEECDDDVIVPAAEDVDKIHSKTLHQREEVSY